MFAIPTNVGNIGMMNFTKHQHGVRIEIRQEFRLENHGLDTTSNR